MTRLIPHPVLSTTLVVLWLMLTRFSLGYLILGTALALVAGRAYSALHPVRPRADVRPAPARPAVRQQHQRAVPAAQPRRDRQGLRPRTVQDDDLVQRRAHADSRPTIRSRRAASTPTACSR